MTYIRAKLLIPKNIYEQGDMPQWIGKVNGDDVEIYYDDDMSSDSPTNVYAVFSDKGFHGWLEFGFVMQEILKILKSEPTDYKFAHDELM